MITEQNRKNSVLSSASDKQYNEVNPTEIEFKNELNSIQIITPKEIIQKNKKQLNKKKCLMISIPVVIVLTLIAVAIFCSIYLKDHSKIDGKMTRSGSGIIAGQQMKYQQFDIDVTFQDSSKSKVTLFSTQQKAAIQKSDSQGQQINEEIDIICYTANMDNSNEHYRFCNNQLPSEPHQFFYETFVNGEDLIKQIKNSNQVNGKRMMQQDEQYLQNFSINQETGEVEILNQQIKDFNDELHKEGLQIEFNFLQQMEIQNQKEINIESSNQVVISQKMKNLQNPKTLIEDSQNLRNTDLKNRRMLGFFGGVIKNVVSVVKVAGPVIGAVAGGVAGFVVGGPAGMVAGGKLGWEIGSAAQSIAKACLPTSKSGNVIIKCDPKEVVKQTGLQIGGSFISSMIPFGKITGIFK